MAFRLTCQLLLPRFSASESLHRLKARIRFVFCSIRLLGYIVAMNATLRRRWYRFNLRTMFALITLVCLGCGWVGYQLDWIRQRHGFLKSHQWPQSSNTKEIGYTICKPIYGVRAPGMLWVFGERGEGAIYLDHKYSAEEAKQIQAMFPEARVSNICYEIGRPYYTPSQTDWR